MVEDTELLTTDDDGEEVEIRLLAKVDKGENVRAAGSDVKTGDLVLQKGERILSPGGEIGTLAFVGCKEVCGVLLVPCHVWFEISGPGQSASKADCRDPEYGKRTR